MKVIKTVKTLANPKDLEWNTLVFETLGSDVHPNRVEGFLLSREALREAFLTFGRELPPHLLKLENYHQIKSFPEFTLSLSHSRDLGAAVLADRKEYLSLGIDIENENREVKDSIWSRVSHPQDVSLRKIELWCLKEAAFKALMNTDSFPAPIEFSSIEIQHKMFSHSPSGISGEWELHQEHGHIVAIASVKA